MSAVLEWFIFLFTVGIEGIIIVILSTCFFSQYPSQKLYFLSVLGYISISIIWLLVWNSCLSDNVRIKYLTNAIILLSWLTIAYRRSIIKSLFFIAAIFSYLTIVDIIYMVIFIPADGILQFALQDPYAYCTLCCGTKITELFGAIIVRNIVKNRKLLNKSFRTSDWVMSLFFPLSTLVVSVIISRIIWTNLDCSTEYAVCMLAMLMIDFLSIYFLEQYNKSQCAIRDNAILRQNLKLESEHIRSIQESYAQQRKQTHDFYNQLATLQGLAENGASLETFSKYLGTLLATKPQAIFFINTHRTVVDIILSQKVSAARDQGIDFQFQLVDLSRFPLPDDALVVILTNLIDNAIEACRKVPMEKDRFVKLVMKIEEKTAWLCIENTTAAPVEIHDNYVSTTKGDPLLHGYGLKNISTLIGQYKGMYVLDYREEDRRFCFYSKFPFSG